MVLVRSLAIEESSKGTQGRGSYDELLSLVLIAIVVFGGWYGFTAILQTPTPFFVVSSGSMRPTLDVGDIILVSGADEIESLEAGEIIVFTLPTDKNRVIVHRVNKIAINTKGDLGIITKGDNNPKIDRWIIKDKDYIGTVILTLPSIGWMAIWLSPPLNYYLVAIIFLIILALELGPRRRIKMSEL